MISFGCYACGAKWDIGAKRTCTCPAEPKESTWVGLSLDDLPDEEFGDQDFLRGARWAEAQLKEKNNA